MKYLFVKYLCITGLLSCLFCMSLAARHRGSCHRRHSSYGRSCCPRYYPVPVYYPYGSAYWEPPFWGGFGGYYPGYYSGFGIGPRFGFGFSFGL